MRCIAFASALAAVSGCALGAGVGYQTQSVKVHTGNGMPTRDTTLSSSFHELRLIGHHT